MLLSDVVRSAGPKAKEINNIGTIAVLARALKEKSGNVSNNSHSRPKEKSARSLPFPGSGVKINATQMVDNFRLGGSAATLP
jgi:hypothetical protein